MFRNVLLGTILAVTSVSAIAANWFELGTTKVQAKYSVDLESIRERNLGYETIRTAWILWDHTYDKTVKERTAKTLYEIKCDSGEMRITQSLLYKADGSIQRSDNFTNISRFEVVAPDTAGSSIFDFVCNWSL